MFEVNPEQVEESITYKGEPTMNELMNKPDYMVEKDGEYFMDGRHVAEIIGKEFKKIIRDLKTIVHMEQNPEMVRNRDHADSINLFSVKGIVCIKDERGYIKDALINEHYCRLLEMYGDFKAVIRMNREWEAMREYIVKQRQQPLLQLQCEIGELHKQNDELRNEIEVDRKTYDLLLVDMKKLWEEKENLQKELTALRKHDDVRKRALKLLLGL